MATCNLADWSIVRLTDNPLNDEMKLIKVCMFLCPRVSICINY